MITVKAIYFGSRSFFDTINVKGKEQKVFVKLHEFRDITDVNGNIIAQRIECKDAGSYENLQQFKKYHITASEITSARILRPSKCELIVEPDEDNQGIQEAVNGFKADLLDEATFIKRMKDFSNEAMANYIKFIIQKSKQK